MPRCSRSASAELRARGSRPRRSETERAGCPCRSTPAYRDARTAAAGGTPPRSRQRSPSLHRRLPSLVLVAAVSPRALDVAEAANGLPTRVLDRNAPGLQFIDPHLQMALDLLVDLCLHARRRATQIPERRVALLRCHGCSGHVVRSASRA